MESKSEVAERKGMSRKETRKFKKNVKILTKNKFILNLTEKPRL